VTIVDGGGDISRALFGEIMMTVAKSKGAIGAVFGLALVLAEVAAGGDAAGGEEGGGEGENGEKKRRTKTIVREGMKRKT
jgi:hypothetical protein